MIHEAIVNSLSSRPSRKPTKELYVSDLGYHPQKTMRRVLYGEQTRFEPKILDIMQQGTVLEADTAAHLAFSLGGVQTNFPLFNDVWSGYADMVLGHGVSEEPIIVEHKATSDKGFDMRGDLPKGTHVCQLWMYGRLYEEMFGVTPKLVIYYRAWQQWAEFTISQETNRIRADGWVNGVGTTRQLFILPDELRQELESFYRSNTLPGDLGIRVDTWNYAEESYNRLRTE